MLGGKGPLARVNPLPRSLPSLELEGLYKQLATFQQLHQHH